VHILYNKRKRTRTAKAQTILAAADAAGVLRMR